MYLLKFLIAREADLSEWGNVAPSFEMILLNVLISKPVAMSHDYRLLDSAAPLLHALQGKTLEHGWEAARSTYVWS